MFILWYNPSCSKCLEAKNFLEVKKVDFVVFDYIQEKPQVNTLKELVKKLGFDDVRKMLRMGEQAYHLFDIGNPETTQEEILNIVARHPTLIERPIVTNDTKAVIAKPCNEIEKLLK